MYELTLFKNQFDNKTHRRTTFFNWLDFVVCLRDSYTKPGEKGGPNSSPLLTPAVFDVGTTRSNKSVLYWSPWCCVDVDDPIDGCGDVESLRTWLNQRYCSSVSHLDLKGRLRAPFCFLKQRVTGL